MVGEEIKSVIEKATIINIAALVMIALFVVIVAVGIVFAFLTENPFEAFLVVKDYAIPMIMAVFLAYGITQSNNRNSAG